MPSKSMTSQIKNALDKVHFGLSPDSDIYINKIYVYRKSNHELLSFDNSTDLIKNVIEHKITTEDMDMDTVSVIFSDILFKEIEQEYKKYAIK